MQNIKYSTNWIPYLHLWSNVNVHIPVALVTGLLQFLETTAEVGTIKN